MLLVCSSSALNEGLQIAARAMSTRTANPILEGVLLEARMGQLRITASDERLTILTRVDCEVSESGRGVIPGKLFIDIVRRLQDNPTIEIGMNERFIFNIVSGASVMNVAGQDGDLYPALPALTDVSEFTLPQDSLRGMIEKTQFAIAVDDARDVLTGALLRGNALSAATDAAAGFVADSIAATDPEAPTALGVWFEPLLGLLAPREV